jgi:hypothetical protein
MSAATHSVSELASSIGYSSVKDCARNMGRAANYAKDKYPFLTFNTKHYYVTNYYREEWVCVDGMMCQKSRWLTAIFCANNLLKLASVHKFLTQEFMSVSIEDLVNFFIVQEYCDAQILQVLLGLSARLEFINLVEAMLSVHQIEPQAIWWEYYRQPKSYNYNLPLLVVKSLVHHVITSKDFDNNPMREFVTRLNNYFNALDAQSKRLCQGVEENTAIALESVSELMAVDVKSEARQSLDLTVPLLLFMGLLAYLGWIHPSSCW